MCERKKCFLCNILNNKIRLNVGLKLIQPVTTAEEKEQRYKQAKSLMKVFREGSILN